MLSLLTGIRNTKKTSPSPTSHSNMNSLVEHINKQTITVRVIKNYKNIAVLSKTYLGRNLSLRAESVTLAVFSHAGHWNLDTKYSERFNHDYRG